MNTPEIYLVEPYNAYATKGKKKHLHQILEEEALMARIVAEQQALQEAAAKQAHPTLPPQAPPTSQAGSQGYSGGEGASGGPNTTGGGGGMPRPQFFHPASASYTFVPTPTTSSAPTLVQVSVTDGGDTFALGGATVTWGWGDNTTLINGPAASHTYTGTGSFDITMTVTSTLDGTTLGTQVSEVTMSVPTVVAAFTVTGATVVSTAGFYTASVNDPLTFVNGTSTNNPSNTLTYNWQFNSASLTSTATNPTFTFTTASTYAVILGASGSFDKRNSGTRNIQIV
jgi:hypothetical protein